MKCCMPSFQRLVWTADLMAAALAAKTASVFLSPARAAGGVDGGNAVFGGIEDRLDGIQAFGRIETICPKLEDVLHGIQVSDGESAVAVRQVAAIYRSGNRFAEMPVVAAGIH